jgi:hypothetical protein
MAIAAAWLLGALAVLGRLALGRWGAARLGSQAEPVTDPAWTGLLRGLSRELGLARPVRLLRGGGATMPMTWGIVHPAVLLPAEAEAWPEERRRVVLMHELAHVARHDCLTQTLASAACALYWFHPAAWYAARRLRVERELACDDRVLQAGTRARDYAGHLLEVARAFRPARLAAPVAVSMARPSQLEGRLLAVLDSVRDRRIPGRAAAAGAAALALALLLPLAAVRPGSAQQTPVQHVTFGGPKPWKDTARVRPPRSPDAYPDYDAALRAGVQDLNIAAHPGERLTLRLPDHVSARVLPWDRPSVHVRVDDTGLRVTGERGPGGVNVTVTGAPRTHGPDPHVRIMAPREFSVHTESNGGGLEIGALNGTFTGSVTGGGLAFRGTRGTVRMSARGGGALIQDAHLDGRLEMDGGGVMMDGNSGNLDVTGAAATVHGSPGGTLRVDAPARTGTGSEDDAEVACTSGGACTITARTAEGRRTGTSVSTGRGGNEVTVQAAGSGRATAIATGPARASAVSVAGTPARNSVTVYPAGTGEATTVRAVSSSGAATTTVVQGSGGWTVTTGEPRGSATTIRAWDGAATRERDGYAYATGDVEGRIAAVRAMARNAPPDAAAEGLARLAYTDDDVRVQRAAVEELGKMRTRQSVKQLGRISRRHPDASVRAQAAAALR